MADARKPDPLRNFRFKVEIDGITQAGFSEVAIAESTVDAIDYRDGDDPPHVRKLQGLAKYGNITLKWGASDSLDVVEWFKQANGISGNFATPRKTITVIGRDEEGKDRVKFVIHEAWPVKYDPSDFNAKGNEVLIELVEFTNEGIERQKA